ncbi:threonine/serine exporter family protein [Macrococcus armenti]|uniref:threonine/serine exporter family protein n=1 Tax=Macrococcus armenti TaxID=2875764 RepID=UPI001CC9AFF6|nr:threonine/serine exporter family protein [Macrococcus armenti]UBH13673.1 threonine/serine exporter family protein [Macrococcus armenti]UBH22900.1 threonine/serine exporter family protein [Macrococcus armenti]
MISNQLYDEQKVKEVAMLAGKILLESGAETYRVEDTMTRIAEYYGLHHTHSFVTPTAIIFSLNDKSSTRLYRVSDRTTDLEKISEVNEISRAITSGKVTLQAAKMSLDILDKANLQFKFWLKVLSSGLVSMLFLFMFKGHIQDALPAFISGLVGYYICEQIGYYFKIRFFAEFAGSVAIALIAIGFVNYFFSSSIDKIIISGVMPLVPGVPITNAIRDMMAGQLIAGITKGVEAALTAFAIGAGVGVTFIIFGGIS